MPTSRQYAIDNKIPERTVRSWIETLTEEEREALGIERVGKAWAGPVAAWQALAAQERRTGPRVTPKNGTDEKGGMKSAN